MGWSHARGPESHMTPLFTARITQFSIYLRYLWVGLMLVDLRDMPNKHLLNMDVAVVGDVGGDTAAAMHHFFAASPQVRKFYLSV